jgi:hypothetical protein
VGASGSGSGSVRFGNLGWVVWVGASGRLVGKRWCFVSWYAQLGWSEWGPRSRTKNKIKIARQQWTTQFRSPLPPSLSFY